MAGLAATFAWLAYLEGMFRSLVFCTLLLGCTTVLLAQPAEDQRFAAFAYGGLNLAQIDGDYYFGYNKVGLRFGIGSNVIITPKSYISVGLGYNQGGAKASRSERYDRSLATINLRVNAAEVPVLFHYRLGKKEEYTVRANHQLYRSGEIQTGLAVSRVTGTSFRRTGLASQLSRKENFVAVEDEFASTDLYWIVGFAVPLNMNISAYAQHGKSILGIYRPGEVTLDEVLPLYPYYFNFGLRYTLY